MRKILPTIPKNFIKRSSSNNSSNAIIPDNKENSCSLNSTHYDFETTVKIPVPGTISKTLEFHPIWLRHHCPCDKCFNPQTFQKMVIPSHLPGLSTVEDLSTSSISQGSVQINWNDGHKSTFGLPWLGKISEKIGKIPRDFSENQIYKYENSLPPPPKDPSDLGVPYEDFMNPGSTQGLSRLLESIIHHGYGIVKGAPPDYESTKKIVLRISHPASTIYGDFSEWTSNLQHADTAYTSDYVHLHTDTSYFTEPMGLQMFHCLKHEGTGGLNCIVDGLRVAKDLYEKSPEQHSMLSQALVPCQYLDPGKYHFSSVDKIIKHDEVGSNKFERFRYNPHDVSTLTTIPHHLLPLFYKSLCNLSSSLESSPVWLKLSPGLVIFLDNWRVLHGRTEFTGFRHLCGAYISRSDWQSKARVLGLLEEE